MAFVDYRCDNVCRNEWQSEQKIVKDEAYFPNLGEDPPSRDSEGTTLLLDNQSYAEHILNQKQPATACQRRNDSDEQIPVLRYNAADEPTTRQPGNVEKQTELVKGFLNSTIAVNIDAGVNARILPPAMQRVASERMTRVFVEEVATTCLNGQTITGGVTECPSKVITLNVVPEGAVKAVIHRNTAVSATEALVAQKEAAESITKSAKQNASIPPPAMKRVASERITRVFVEEVATTSLHGQTITSGVSECPSKVITLNVVPEGAVKAVIHRNTAGSATEALVAQKEAAESISKSVEKNVANESATKPTVQNASEETFIKTVVAEAASTKTALKPSGETFRKTVVSEGTTHSATKPTVPTVVAESTESVSNAAVNKAAIGNIAKTALQRTAAKNVLKGVLQRATAESTTKTVIQETTVRSVVHNVGTESVVKSVAQKAATESAAKTLAKKAATDSVAKAIAKKAATDSVTEAVVKKAATDGIAKAVAKKAATDSVAKAIAKKAVTDSVTKAVVKKAATDGIVKTVAKKAATDGVAKAVAKKAASESVSKAVQKTATESVTKVVVKKAAGEAITKSIAHKTATQSVVKEVVKKGAAEAISKEVVKKSTSHTVSKTVVQRTAVHSTSQVSALTGAKIGLIAAVPIEIALTAREYKNLREQVEAGEISEETYDELMTKQIQGSTGAVIGGFVGTVLGAPLPVVGPIIGGTIGSLAGQFFGRSLDLM